MEGVALQGFLSEYWKTGASLPRIRGLGVLLYYLRRGLVNLWALPGSALISVLSIAISLYVFAGVLLILENISSVLNRLGTTLSVVAYVKEGAEPAAVNEFVRELEVNPRVRSVRFVSKEAALEELKKDFGSRSDVLRGLERENPLPASIDVVLQADELKVNSVDDLLSNIKNRPVIDEVSFGSDWVDRVARILRGFRSMSMVALLIVLALVVTLIGNTIKLVLYLRRDEISVMQLVGATDSFVKIPFILTGLLQGMVGGVISLLSLKIVFSLFARNLGDMNILGVVVPAPIFLGSQAMLAVVCLGLFVGGVGSFLAVNRFMKV